MTLKLTFDGKRFLFLCSFKERDTPRQAGFKFINAGGPHHQWCTESPVVAAKLRAYGDESALGNLTKNLIHVAPWLSPLPPPPKGLALKEFQIPAVEFALSRNHSYLGLPPGAGKTICAATITSGILQDPRFETCRVLYICPPFLTRNVEEELLKWLPDAEVGIYGQIFDPEYTQILVFPDTQLKSLQNYPYEFAAVFIDEAHRFKNMTAKRTQYLFGHKRQKGITALADRVICMSGTPMPNRPIELYPVLSKLAPETIDYMSEFEFGRKYCAGYQGKWGWDFSGASNLKELNTRVVHPKGPFMLRLKKDALGLPPKTEEAFVIADDQSKRLLKMEQAVGERYSDAEDVIKAQIIKAQIIKAKGGEEDIHLATYRRLLGIEKVPAVAEYVDSILDETSESVLVFAFHKEVIAELASRLKAWNPAVITGDVNPEKRHRIVKAFQSEPHRRLLIGNYVAMGVGFNLTKATRGVFAEFDWTPGVNEQAGDRMHRIGQRSSVLIQYMVFKDSLDKRIMEALNLKRKNISQI